MTEHILLEGLNDAQKKAVVHENGPLLLLAGAGSGKTKTLTHRIAYLVRVSGVHPRQILAVTFTNKAAKEMRERLLHLMGVPETDKTMFPWLGTFHSVCVRLLRIEGENIEIPKNFVIFDDSDKISAIKQAMKQHHVTDKQYSPRSISSMISSAKNDLVSPQEYEAHARLPLQKVVARVYPTYERIRRDAAALDFDDIIIETVRLLRTVEGVRAKWQQYFSHVLIDEYQDTNTAQYNLVKLLLGDNQNICVVGDDWQSIYSWRGADYKNILNFERDYAGATVIKLEQNYRSTKPILDAAHAVITKNKARSHKELWTDKEEGMPVQVSHVPSELAEAEGIVSHVATQVRTRARNYSDYAVLYRTNAQSRSLEETFLRYGVPYKIVGGTRFYDRAEIKDIIAYLRLLYQPRDSASFLRIANVPTRGIGAKSLDVFMQWQQTTGHDIVRALSNIEQCSGLTARAKSAFDNFGLLLQRFEQVRQNEALPALIEALAYAIDYYHYLEDGTPKGEDRIQNVKELISSAHEYIDIGLEGFLEEVALVSSADDTADSSVTFMTLHAAKGLEFPVVFIAGMEESIFPHSRALYDEAEMEEERRLCYVGMTRAREELHLYAASSRLLFGSRQYNVPSRFLSEIDTVEAPAESFDREPEYEMDNVANELELNDAVRHATFGEGTVVGMGEGYIEVKFSKIGTKRLNPYFAPIQKLN
jgi:DNA helicase II / ATP-dependent DNA helicase PcrA